MKVRLTRKFSNVLNGLDLTRFMKGDTLDLASREAQMLIAEGWAEPADRPARDQASDRRRTSRRKKPR